MSRNFAFALLLPICAAIAGFLGARGDDRVVQVAVVDEYSGPAVPGLSTELRPGVAIPIASAADNPDEEAVFESFGLTRADLPAALAEHAEIQQIEDAVFGSGGPRSQAALFANDWNLTFASAPVGGTFPAIPDQPPQGTISVFALVLRAADEAAAHALVEELSQAQGDGGGHVVVSLRAFGDEASDEADIQLDFERTYVPFDEHSLAVQTLGSLADGSATSTSVLDYDSERNEYRSERELFRQHTEIYSFAVGRYVVMIQRTSVSCCAEPPDDMNALQFAEAIYGRLATKR